MINGDKADQWVEGIIKIGQDLWKKVQMERDEIIAEWERCKEPDMAKKIEVELPEPPSSGGYACCPSGDTEYEEAFDKWREKCNAVILKAVPKGYNLKSSEVKESRVVRHYAVIEVDKK